MAGRATGIGSWSGTDAMGTARATFAVLGEAPHVPYLPELPERGPGSDLVGRGAALLVEMPVDLQPSGWRLVDHPGRDLNRALSWLQQDLDVLAEVADGYVGPLKVQVTGPWTLAASLHLARLERAVADAGACRDIIASLAEGVRRHVQRVRDLVPGAEVVLQVDEPSLAAVLQGGLPTASGFGRLRAVEEPIAVQGLRDVFEAAQSAGAVGTALHCCASVPPLGTLRRAVGQGALSLDLSRLDVAAWEQVGEALDEGVSLWAGAVRTPSSEPSAPQEVKAAIDAVLVPWRRLGMDLRQLRQVVVTPACGLAGVPPIVARQMLITATRAAAELAEAADA